MKRIRLLVVDDSRVFRAIIEDALRDDPTITIVGSVWSGEKALEVFQELAVDVMTLDIEMPGIGGLETLQRIQMYNSTAEKKIGVIMVSAHTQAGAAATLRALELGAFDFMPKPVFKPGATSPALFRMQLASRIRGCAAHLQHPSVETEADLPPAPQPAPLPASPVHKPQQRSKPPRAILIGVSTGGPKALNQMLPRLSELVECPILIVQHMPPFFTQSLAHNLDSKCAHQVCEAEEGMIVEGRRIFIAPGGKHMVVRREGENIVTGLNGQQPENGCRPSVDVLFRSAAIAYNGDVIAIILTGMGNDGAASLHALKRAGAYIIVQDEATSVVWGMPGAAVKTGTVDNIVGLDKIPEHIAAVITCSR
jgi:two-component system, chemotaxis family, protein-glutamate methylesterase/glutaminase